MLTNKSSINKPSIDKSSINKSSIRKPTISKSSKNKTSIGTKNESSLHNALKFRYSGIEGSTEKPVGDYVCDGLTSEGEIIEIQIGSFGPIKEKIKKLVQTSKVRLIHPIVIKKHIELYDLNNNLLYRRKSPRAGKPWDVFNALIYAPELGLLKNLSIELAVIDVVEKRVNDGKGSWRRKGVSISDRFLDVWHHSIVLSRRGDYNQFIPFKKDESFTVRNLAKKAGINTTLARKTLYVLAKMNLVEKTGKQANAFIFKRK